MRQTAAAGIPGQPPPVRRRAQPGDGPSSTRPRSPIGTATSGRTTKYSCLLRSRLYRRGGRAARSAAEDYVRSTGVRSPSSTGPGLSLGPAGFRYFGSLTPPGQRTRALLRPSRSPRPDPQAAVIRMRGDTRPSAVTVALGRATVARTYGVPSLSDLLGPSANPESQAGQPLVCIYSPCRRTASARYCNAGVGVAAAGVIPSTSRLRSRAASPSRR